MVKTTNPNARIEVIIPSEKFHETINFNLSNDRVVDFANFFREVEPRQAYDSMRILLVEEFIADLQKDGWSAKGVNDFLEAIILKQFSEKNKVQLTA